MDEKEPSIMDENETFFSEGAYGCVMYPRVDCYGNLKNKVKKGMKKEMSKIVRNDFTAENEIILGKKINKINKKTKKMIFLPVTRSCIVQKEKVDKYKDCHFFTQDKYKTLTNYKILYANYVKSNTLHTYLFKDVSSLDIKKIFKYYHFMINAIDLMQCAGVIHNDLNMKNVLVTKKEKMHVIDFGRSIMTKKIFYKNGQANMKYLKHFFSIWKPSNFFFWPIEHYLLSFFIKEERSMDEKTLVDIIDLYYNNDKNRVLYLKDKDSRDRYVKHIYKHYEEKFVNTLSYKTHIKEIINEASTSWDLYAICYICFRFIQKNKKQIPKDKYNWFIICLNDSLHYDYTRRPSLIYHQENAKKVQERILHI